MKLAKCGVNHIPILEDVWEIIGWVINPKKSAMEKAEEMLKSEKLILRLI